MDWIDIEKQEPPTDEEVWITDWNTVVKAEVLGREKTGWAISGLIGWVSITHWMPITKPSLPNKPTHPE